MRDARGLALPVANGGEMKGDCGRAEFSLVTLGSLACGGEPRPLNKGCVLLISPCQRGRKDQATHVCLRRAMFDCGFDARGLCDWLVACEGPAHISTLAVWCSSALQNQSPRG